MSYLDTLNQILRWFKVNAKAQPMLVANEFEAANCGLPLVRIART
jgi:hypothetical protein